MRKVTVFILKVYKKTMSPILFPIFGNACRFTPTCSEYTIEAVEKNGTGKGLLLGLKRFLRCNPLSKPGFDPVS